MTSHKTPPYCWLVSRAPPSKLHRASEKSLEQFATEKLRSWSKLYTTIVIQSLKKNSFPHVAVRYVWWVQKWSIRVTDRPYLTARALIGWIMRKVRSIWDEDPFKLGPTYTGLLKMFHNYDHCNRLPMSSWRSVKIFCRTCIHHYVLPDGSDTFPVVLPQHREPLARTSYFQNSRLVYNIITLTYSAQALTIENVLISFFSLLGKVHRR